jgi:hypothetical protein
MDGWLDEGSVGMDIGVGARDGRDQHIFKGLSDWGTGPNV